MSCFAGLLIAIIRNVTGEDAIERSFEEAKVWHCFYLRCLLAHYWARLGFRLAIMKCEEPFFIAWSLLVRFFWQKGALVGCFVGLHSRGPWWDLGKFGERRQHLEQIWGNTSWKHQRSQVGEPTRKTKTAKKLGLSDDAVPVVLSTAPHSHLFTTGVISTSKLNSKNKLLVTWIQDTTTTSQKAWTLPMTNRGSPK